MARLSRFLPVLTMAVGLTGAVLVACASAPTNTVKKSQPVDPGDDYFNQDPPPSDPGLTPAANGDSGAFGQAPERQKPPGGGGTDAGVDAGPKDAGPVVTTYCAGALAAGDLQIAELLISSRTGSGDDGEWVEIRNTRTCTLKLDGVTVDSPRGASAANSVTIGRLDLAPGDTFVVADSADFFVNNGLPGTVYAWNSTDVLKNDGDTIDVVLGGTVVDTLTYPSFTNLTVGRTIEFPSDCPDNVRPDWGRWSQSFDVWTPGFKGTPNAANDDVACY